MAAADQLRGLVKAAASGPLSLVRRVAGRRNINWTPEFMGFGNQLYLWCWAHADPGERQRRTVLTNERTGPWLEYVPDFARARLIHRHEVGLLDKRGFYWADNERYTGDKRGFTEDTRAAFINEVLLPAPLLRNVTDTEFSSDDVLVVNVRRGDFYADWWRPRHGFDVASYVKAAVAGAVTRDGSVRRIHVVSDGIPWCRRHLAELAQIAPMTYGDASPAENFLHVASANRLVITNSTFSLWGAYVAQAIHGESSRIWAPAFFDSTYPVGRCYEYDQDWNFIDELPGGWQPSWVLEGREWPPS